MLFGATDYHPPSRFLEEIPAELVQEIGAKRKRGGGIGAHRESLVATAVRRGETFGGGGIASRPVATPVPTGADQAGFSVGDDVVHNTYGDGVIQSIRGHGDKAEADVHFKGIGQKTLLLAWAPLKKG